jgi:adenylosuccinate synthase
LKICIAYKVNGKTVTEFPGSIPTLEKCQPVYEEMDGWMTPTSHIREYGKLPSQARNYIKRLEEICGCPAKIISIGPKREETIIRTAVI